MKLFDSIKKSAKIRAENAYYTKLYSEPPHRGAGILSPDSTADPGIHSIFAFALLDMTRAYNR